MKPVKTKRLLNRIRRLIFMESRQMSTYATQVERRKVKRFIYTLGELADRGCQ